MEANGERRREERVFLLYNSTREHPIETPSEYISRN